MDNVITGNISKNILDGASGNDTLIGGGGGDSLIGGAGSDTASYANASTGVSVYMGKIQNNSGDAAGDTFKSIENITGSNYADILYADENISVLNGGAGDDVLYGKGDADKLFGGAGRDNFLFKETSDSKPTSADVIYDFRAGESDKIDLVGIDSNTKVAGNNAFTFIGDHSFSGQAGELRFERAARDTFIYGDMNGDRQADFMIRLADAQTLHAGDFLL